MTGTDAAALQAVFDALRAILAARAGGLATTVDRDDELSVDTRHVLPNGKPLFFGAVRRGKRRVSYHLMPVYVQPRLLEGLSPALRQRMHGKSCFNFTHVDPAVFDELARLTDAGLGSYREQGYA